MKTIRCDKWISNFGLEADFFADADVWTVGDRTHACLQNILGITAFYPDKMTGVGIIQALQRKNHSRVLLISGQNLRPEFIEGLSAAEINFFHFPVYKIRIEGSLEFSANFKNDESNYLIITSPSTVDGILMSLSLNDLSGMKSRIISIGPTTSLAIREKGGSVFIESEVQNINLLYDNFNSLMVKHP